MMCMLSCWIQSGSGLVQAVNDSTLTSVCYYVIYINPNPTLTI